MSSSVRSVMEKRLPTLMSSQSKESTAFSQRRSTRTQGLFSLEPSKVQNLCLMLSVKTAMRGDPVHVRLCQEQKKLTVTNTSVVNAIRASSLLERQIKKSNQNNNKRERDGQPSVRFQSFIIILTLFCCHSSVNNVFFGEISFFYCDS